MATFIRTLKDMLGNQVLPRTRTSAVSLSDGTVLYAYEDNIRGGGGIRPQIIVTAPVGSVITCTDGTVTMTGVSTGTYTFYVPHFGTYTVSSILENQISPIKTLVVDTVTIYHVTLNYFVASIVVTAAEGSALTCKSGATTLTGTANGKYTFLVKSPGTWTLTATLAGKSVQKIVEVTEETPAVYDVKLNYYVVYGVRIDTKNSDPLSSVSYIEGTEAYGMVKGSSEWDTKPIFDTIKPCLLVNGVVSEYLDPNNYGKNLSGGSVDISTNSPGDVMVEFGKGGYKFVKNGDYLDIYVTDDPDAKDDGYVYHPFSYAEEGDCDHFWLGAYLGSIINSDRLRSCSNSTVSVNLALNSYRSAAKGIGLGYEVVNFFQMTWLQILYLVKYGNLNSQVAIGGGYTGAGSISGTGTMNTSGMNAGTPGVYTLHMKLFGLEDFYGNARYFLDGIFYEDGYDIKLTYPGYNTGYNDTATDYKFSIPLGISITSEGYISEVQGTNETGFLIKQSSATDSTYYTDRGSMRANRVASFGGEYNSALAAGVFSISVLAGATTSYYYIGARLSYCYTGK